MIQARFMSEMHEKRATQFSIYNYTRLTAYVTYEIATKKKQTRAEPTPRQQEGIITYMEDIYLFPIATPTFCTYFVFDYEPVSKEHWWAKALPT